MRLLYLDESGSTGTDLDNKHQPIFALSGVCVEDKNWHEINTYFEIEKDKIYSGFKEFEIHTNEIFNSNAKSPFDKNDWKFNFEILEKLADLISSLKIKATSVEIVKKEYKKHFGGGIIVDPYLYAFSIIYQGFNDFLKSKNDFGIIFCDELKKMENSLDLLYPRLSEDNKNIIERTFYLNSKRNNFIQIADFCSFYINKYQCIINGYSNLSTFKKEHCIKIYNQLNTSILGVTDNNTYLKDYDMYFK